MASMCSLLRTCQHEEGPCVPILQMGKLRPGEATKAHFPFQFHPRRHFFWDLNMVSPAP